jgi:hypothetical protein
MDVLLVYAKIFIFYLPAIRIVEKMLKKIKKSLAGRKKLLPLQSRLKRTGFFGPKATVH